MKEQKKASVFGNAKLGPLSLRLRIVWARLVQPNTRGVTHCDRVTSAPAAIVRRTGKVANRSGKYANGDGISWTMRSRNSRRHSNELQSRWETHRPGIVIMTPFPWHSMWMGTMGTPTLVVQAQCRSPVHSTGCHQLVIMMPQVN